MKKIVMLMLAGMLAASVSAQNSKDQGKVIYEEVQKLDIKLEGDAAQFAHALPKERRATKELIFNQEASVYHNQKNAEEAGDVAMEHEGAMVQIKMTEPDNQFYTDLQKKETIEQREFMTRMFLIEDKQDAAGWKLTGEQKEVLGFACQQASKSTSDSTGVIAWFCPEIPVPAGPQNYTGLPGLVLEVNVNDGDRTITATQIDLAAVSAEDILKPKKGKKVSREEFDQIVKEKMEEMGAQAGGQGATFIMRIER